MDRYNAFLTNLPKIFDNAPEVFRLMSENDKKNLSEKKLSLKSFYWTLSENGVFTIPARNPCWVAVINYSLSKIGRKNVFYQKNIFRQKFKWTSKMQFRQHRRKHFARSPRNFTSKCGKGTNFLQATLFSLYAPIVNRMQFWQTHGRVPASKQKKFNPGSEVIWKKIRSVEKKLSKNTLFWTPPENKNLMTPVTFARRPQTFRTISETEEKNFLSNF